MGQNSQEIRVAQFGRIYVAPVGTDVEDDPAVALTSPFVDLGYATEDGVGFNANPSIEEIRSWQKSTPTRRFVTGRDVVASFTLQQVNPENFKLAFGGGEVSEVDPGIYQYDPPADTADLPELVLVVDAQDGDIHDRYEVYRGSVMEGVDFSLVRTGATLLPIQFAALTPDDQDRPWRYLTDDPAFEPAS